MHFDVFFSDSVLYVKSTDYAQRIETNHTGFIVKFDLK